LKNVKDLWRPLLRTADGKSVIFWSTTCIVIMIHAFWTSGLKIDLIKYLFFPLVLLLFFLRSRVISTEPDDKTNMFGLIQVNFFGLVIIYLEFFK
jgi:hypothetical protein